MFGALLDHSTVFLGLNGKKSYAPLLKIEKACYKIGTSTNITRILILLATQMPNVVKRGKDELIPILPNFGVLNQALGEN